MTSPVRSLIGRGRRLLPEVVELDQVRLQKQTQTRRGQTAAQNIQTHTTRIQLPAFGSSLPLAEMWKRGRPETESAAAVNKNASTTRQLKWRNATPLAATPPPPTTNIDAVRGASTAGVALAGLHL